MGYELTAVCTDCSDEPELIHDEGASSYGGSKTVKVYRCPACNQTGEATVIPGEETELTGILDYRFSYE